MPNLNLPAPDLVHAPFTGYTREHWERIADHLLISVRPYATQRHALIELPGPTSMSGRRSGAFEGFARTFMLAAFRVAGANGDDPLDLMEWYAAGLVAGVDSSSPERWPRPDERRQSWVEGAALAIALHESRAWLWDRLDESTQAKVVDWLAGMVPTPFHLGNNWVWFQNVVHAFLRMGWWSVECRADRAQPGHARVVVSR